MYLWSALGPFEFHLSLATKPQHIQTSPHTPTWYFHVLGTILNINLPLNISYRLPEIDISEAFISCIVFETMIEEYKCIIFSTVNNEFVSVQILCYSDTPILEFLNLNDCKLQAPLSTA
jgi:hypothetical protein